MHRRNEEHADGAVAWLPGVLEAPGCHHSSTVGTASIRCLRRCLVKLHSAGAGQHCRFGCSVSPVLAAGPATELCGRAGGPAHQTLLLSANSACPQGASRRVHLSAHVCGSPSCCQPEQVAKKQHLLCHREPSVTGSQRLLACVDRKQHRSLECSWATHPTLAETVAWPRNSCSSLRPQSVALSRRILPEFCVLQYSGFDLMAPTEAISFRTGDSHCMCPRPQANE